MVSPTINIDGRIGTDVEYRKVGESAVARFRVITNDRKKVDDEWTDTNTTGWNVEIWGYHADKVKAHLEKGDPVVITGIIFEDKWTGSDGTEKSSMLVKADHVGLNVGRVK